MTDVRAERDDRLANRPPSVGRMFLDRVAATPDHEAFRFPRDGGWESMSWAEAEQRVRALAAGLLALGIRPEDRVAIASSTRVEWLLADLAIMLAGGATTTVYPSTSHDDVGYILADSGSRVVFAENAAQVEKVRAHRGELPDVTQVVVFDLDDGEQDDWVISLADLESRGRDHLQGDENAVDAAVAAIEPGQLATLIYTSGTTGRPKGVRLTQDAWIYEGIAIDSLGILRSDDVQYLWLPLSHAFGKVLEAAQLAIGFSSAVDGNVDKLVDNLAVVRPTFMAAAPRIFEKVHSRIVRMTEADGGVKNKIFDWAFRVGGRASRLRQEGKEPSGLLAVQFAVADRLVFSKIKARFGGRLRYFVSGSAALSRDVAEWFHAADILILEGYGLTETSAFSFVNRPERWKFGTVGLPAPGTEVKLADDGEVLVKGPGVMTGYHNMPAETAEALTGDGWLRTGDIGELEDGMLRITDRKKDLIKTSGGKYVAPQGIEGLFQAVNPYASQIVVHGDGRKYVVALVTLDEEAIRGWAEGQGLSATSYEDIVRSDEARRMVQEHIETVNGRVNRWEAIKKFEILATDLTIEDGDLTPSLKIKRKAVERKYADLLDGMYDDD
ncbi:MAG: long-chain acyl-CoA synthetase [Actinomycetota bacterium]|nr:long-chain acyl-CoA synthetase [Actinomycetota bacterium]